MPATWEFGVDAIETVEFVKVHAVRVGFLSMRVRMGNSNFEDEWMTVFHKRQLVKRLDVLEDTEKWHFLQVATFVKERNLHGNATIQLQTFPASPLWTDARLTSIRVVHFDQQQQVETPRSKLDKLNREFAKQLGALEALMIRQNITRNSEFQACKRLDLHL